MVEKFGLPVSGEEVRKDIEGGVIEHEDSKIPQSENSDSKLQQLKELGIVARLGTDEWCEVGADELESKRANPFYACVVEDGTRKPLPIAIAEGNPNALAFRDEWLRIATPEDKEYCGYDSILKNFVGGAEGERRPVADEQK
jgi:hypothetical protein